MPKGDWELLTTPEDALSPKEGEARRIRKANNGTVYTVPAGKTFYINTFILLPSGTTGYFEISVGGTLIVKEAESATMNKSFDFYNPLVVDSGESIVIAVPGATSALTVIGWER